MNFYLENVLNEWITTPLSNEQSISNTKKLILSMTKRYCFMTSFGVEQQLIESKYVSLCLSYFQFRGKDYEGECNETCDCLFDGP